jgi:hypothetical protein
MDSPGPHPRHALIEIIGFLVMLVGMWGVVIGAYAAQIGWMR